MKSNIIKKKASNQDIFQKVKKQLDEVQKMTSEVGELMAEARNILIAYSRCKTESGYENFTDMILESSKKGERLTEKLRRLSLEVVLDQVKYEQYQSELVAVHGIEMDYSDEILKIIMPVLIPHRKEHYTDYLYKPLYIAFKQWCICQNQEQKRIPEYEKCTVCFVHLYNRDLPLGRIRDHDNFEEKHVLDVISNFFLASDSGLHVDTYHITRMAEQDATEVYIMDTENFPKWLQKM